MTHPIRIAFEKWAVEQGKGNLLEGTYDDREWVYRNWIVQLRWETWQHAYWAGNQTERMK